MSPQEQVSPDFDWEGDFNQAEVDLQSASPEASSTLAKALDSAFHMANICQRAIARGPAWEGISATSEDWHNFLARLSYDAEFVYPMYLSLLERGDGGDLPTRFANIAVAAVDAQIQISTMPRPSLLVQRKAVMHLRDLMRNLQAAKAMLVSSPEGEVTGLPVVGNEEYLEIPPRPEAVLVPVIGQIAAGDLNLAEEMFEDLFPLPRQLVGENDVFLLRVRGESMTGAGIVDGDWIAIHRQPAAENGDIVVAMIDDEATVKKCKITEGKVWLLPKNPAYSEIPGERAIIIGKVVAVFRKV